MYRGCNVVAAYVTVAWGVQNWVDIGGLVHVSHSTWQWLSKAGLEVLTNGSAR